MRGLRENERTYTISELDIVAIVYATQEGVDVFYVCIEFIYIQTIKHGFFSRIASTLMLSYKYGH